MNYGHKTILVDIAPIERVYYIIGFKNGAEPLYQKLENQIGGPNTKFSVV